MSSYCAIPNHVHLSVQPLADYEPSDVLKSWKSFTASEINECGGRSRSVWEPESYDTMVHDTEHLWKVLRYIGKNPEKARIPEHKLVRWVSPL